MNCLSFVALLITVYDSYQMEVYKVTDPKERKNSQLALIRARYICCRSSASLLIYRCIVNVISGQN